MAGDVTSMGGGGWVFLIFLLPFAFLGGIIALIIWLIQRSRRPAPVPAYTLHRKADGVIGVDDGCTQLTRKRSLPSYLSGL